jgi:hypothetical protein
MVAAFGYGTFWYRVRQGSPGRGRNGASPAPSPDSYQPRPLTNSKDKGVGQWAAARNVEIA